MKKKIFIGASILMIAICLGINQKLFSCKKLQENNEIVIESKILNTDTVIDFTFKKNKLGNFYDSIINKIDFIPLETTNESLIGHISKIIMMDSLILISDNYKTNQLLLFDNQGQFIRKISNRGRGGEEYLDLADIAVDKLNKIIYILDGDQGKLLLFNYNGLYIRSIKLPFDYALNCNLQNDSIMIFDNGLRNNAPIIDEKYYNLIVYNIKQDKISNVFFEYNVEKVNRRNRSEKFSNYNFDSYYW